MIELRQGLKDLIVKEYGYDVLDMISSIPYRDVSDFLLKKLEEVKIDYDFFR